MLPHPRKSNMNGWPWEPVETQVTVTGELPKISIVVPLYNHGTYIEETLRSILQQGYPHLELIVMDGGSTDDSIKVVEHYDAHISYWESKRDKGQSHAINKGFERCTGDIITFQQSDDIYLPGTLHKIAALYQNKPRAGVFAGGFHFMDTESKRIGVDIPPYLNKKSPVDITLGPPSLYRIHQVATFYTKHALDSVGRFVREDLSYTMDRELLYRVIKSYEAVLSREVFSAFRKHPGSKSTHSIEPFAREFADLYMQHIDGKWRDDRKRERMARHHLWKGKINKAKSSDNHREKILSILSAIIIHPSGLLKRSFLSTAYKCLFRRQVFQVELETES
jgi:glycosyltransferase involved in cell wall biosynthesis